MSAHLVSYNTVLSKFHVKMITYRTTTLVDTVRPGLSPKNLIILNRKGLGPRLVKKSVSALSTVHL